MSDPMKMFAVSTSRLNASSVAGLRSSSRRYPTASTHMFCCVHVSEKLRAREQHLSGVDALAGDSHGGLVLRLEDDIDDLELLAPVDVLGHDATIFRVGVTASSSVP
eukprot:46340-Hanusia_phi.AAC.1